MIIFAGPSLSHASIQLIKQKGLQLNPPVKRGEILELIRSSGPRSIAIVDGFFRQSLAVGHEEILRGIEQGWTIIGLSSIGAIRAYELRDMGMIGYGEVYQRFVDAEDFQDDEVALEHLPMLDYKNISEPLVHYRACIEALIAAGKLNEPEGITIIQFMKNMYFGYRTMPVFQAKLEAVTGRKFEEMVIDFDKYRIKQKDLVRFIQEQ